MDNVTSANEHKFEHLLPVTVMAAIFMVVGVVGNVTVVVVMATKMSKKAINCFVLALATSDLFSCIVCVPVDILELRYPYLFTFPALCKMLRFSRSLSTTTSGFLLIAIAAERYRLICKYNRAHFSGKQAMLTSFGVFGLALLVSWPSLVLFGQKTVQLKNGLHGIECSISDDYRLSVYPVMYYILLIALFFGTFISLCVLYVLVGLRIWRARKIKSRRFSEARVYSLSTLTRDKINNNSDIVSDDLDKETLKRGIYPCVDKNSKRKEYSRRRTTFIMAVMTSVFLVSCLPYIIISICRFLISDIDLHISTAAEVFFHFSLKSFIVSAAVNPYIYGFCNERFKQELFRFPLVNRIIHRPEKTETTDASFSPHPSGLYAEEPETP